MHVKINIPPKRSERDRWHFPDLEQPSKHYTVPLSSIMLKEDKCLYIEAEYSDIERKYIETEKEMHRYWISCPVIKEEWAEIHYAEYARLSKILYRLNLTEVNEHNKRALQVGATEHQFEEADIRAFLRSNIQEELDELESELQ